MFKESKKSRKNNNEEFSLNNQATNEKLIQPIKYNDDLLSINVLLVIIY
jgi:hypothetical protein